MRGEPMATTWEDRDVKCPYFKGVINNHSKTYISCEGLEYPGSMMRYFPNWEVRRKYMIKYCKAKEYWSCPISEIIDRMQYEQAEKTNV